MKKIIGDRVYSIKDLQEIVIVRLRALGFVDVSEESIYTNETHRSLFKEAVKLELNNLNQLKNEFLEVLAKIENV